MITSATRRRFLRLCGAAVFGSAAGCSTLAERDEAFTLCRFEIHNEDRDPHRVHVRIEADDSVIHDETYDLSGATGDTVADRELNPRDWFDGTARSLTLTGRVDDQESVGPVDVTASELGENAEIIYHVKDDGTLDIKYLAGGADSCAPPTTG